ncbi:MAG: hypothetical protein AAF532_15290 [Planctomycetota bacterium]
MRSTRVFAAALVASLAGSGCVALDRATVETHDRNPIVVRANNDEDAWERAVATLHDFKFPILRENKLDGVIETDYRVGSGLFEPWNADAVGLGNKLEGTLQSMRRKVFLTLTPTRAGYEVGVQALKELEDVPGVGRAGGPGRATFQSDRTLRRDLDVVGGPNVPGGWAYVGRDHELEAAILRRAASRFE